MILHLTYNPYRHSWWDNVPEFLNPKFSRDKFALPCFVS